MTLTELKTQVLDLVSKDRQKQALAIILANLKADAYARPRFIQLQGRLTGLERDVASGLISYEKQSLEQNRIRQAVTDLLTDIASSDLWQGQSPEPATINISELDALAQQGLKRQAELLLKKINRTREALALEDDPGRQIRYETQLEQWEAELIDLKQRVGL